jgi:dipeptidyl aminopeptidase/acylaminoacyl peptidase
MRPSDLSRLVSVADPRLAPDGRSIAFVVKHTGSGAGTPRSAIWLAAVDGSSAPVRISEGSGRDGSPVWSPDGTQVAFTRSNPAPPEGPAARHQLLVVSVDGSGAPIAVAEHQHEGFSSPTWSPDGAHLAYVQRVRDDEYGLEDRIRPPRRIDRLANRVDGVGWTIDRRSQVFVVPLDGSTSARQLTDGPFEHGRPAWAPDSRRLVCAAARHDDWDLDPAVDLWVLDAATTAPPSRITDTDWTWNLPSWSPDGTRVAAVTADLHAGYRHQQVAVVELASGAVTICTPNLDRACTPPSNFLSPRPPAWVGDGWLVVSAEDRGRVPLLRVPADGSTVPELLVGGDRWITGFDVTVDGTSLAFCATSTTVPPELFSVVSGEERQLTTVQADFLAACPAQPAERFTVPSPAGDGDIDAWMMRPPRFDPSSRHPMLLQIHGGPPIQHGDRWFDEAQLYATAGFVVVYANPHGSTGSTELWARALRSPRAAADPGSGWGGSDFDDLMAVVDAALEREPAIDPSRLGVLGGSYGGYLTSWIVAHTNRFAAACSERSANNLLTFESTSFRAGLLRWELGISPIDDADEYLRMSPISHVRQIQTPMLILHADQDLRANVGQADQLFTLLRLQGREVEYWRFPAESHHLSYAGSPEHRRQRAEIILDWFDRWIGRRAEHRP